MTLQVRRWLEARGFGGYAHLFESRQIDADALPLLTEAHLTEMGIPVGPRVKLLAALADLSKPPAQQTAGAERRRMTVMFADLVGSTAWANRLDPEDLRDLIREYQRVVVNEIARYDGNVARYVGDGVLVYFGYPRAHEDDAERAVRAALKIIEAVSALHSPLGHPLAAHIGIASGLVVVGDLLFASTGQEHVVVGETPNLAARLVDLAAPGQVLVSASTRALIKSAFDLRDLGPQQVKGGAAPVLAYSVLSARALETRFDAQQSAQLTALVGRDKELMTLHERWQLASAGHGQVVLLIGEAGIGKSRILRALADRLADGPNTRIVNQCSPYHADSALFPMIQHLTQAAGLTAADDVEAKLDRLETLLTGAGVSEILLIAALLGIDASSRYGKLDLTPDQQRARTFEALFNQIVRFSQQAPILWILEDAHWIDPTSLELMELCLDRLTDLRVLAVITARPDFTHDFGAHQHMTCMSLGRLGHRHVAAMVDNLAGGKPVPKILLSEIASKTDGVPLFVEELTKAILESDLLHETDDAFVLDGPLKRISLPASLHDSMMARLDRHQPLKEVAQTAACIGREFSYELLSSIWSQPEQELRDALGRLEEAELIFRRGGSPERQYVFKHALVRDAAYESLLNAKRHAIHARILTALEATPDIPPEILAQHATEAGRVERAIDYWEAAATLAIGRPAYQEAISRVNQALRLAETMPDERVWQERRLQLMLLLGQATIPLRGYSHSDTLSVLMRAQELVAALGDTPLRFSVAYAMWVVYYVRGEHLKALSVAQDICERAREERSNRRMLSGLRSLGISQMILGDPVTAHSTFTRAEELAALVHQQSREQRIAVAQRFGADPEIATQFHVALTLWALGHIDKACVLAKRTVTAARTMGHVHTLGHALAHGAIVAVVARNADDALELSAETIAFADEYDMDLWRGYGAILNAYAHVLSGRPATSIPIMERGLRQLARTQTGTMVPTHRAVYAYALAHEGHFKRAAREAALVREELSAGTERYFWTDCLCWRGHYLRLLADGNAEARAAYTEALDHARQQRSISWELHATTSLAQLSIDNGEREQAAALLAPLVARFTEGFGTHALRDALTLLKSIEVAI